MMTKDEYAAAIAVAEHEIMKLTHEFLRKGQGFKMRTVGSQIHAIIASKEYYEKELKKLEDAAPKRGRPPVNKED